MPNPAATGAIQKPKQQKKLPTVQSRSELHFLRLSEKVDLLSKVFEWMGKASELFYNESLLLHTYLVEIYTSTSPPLGDWAVETPNGSESKDSEYF